ncbi:hypothetical protein TNCV_531681 [Trichonephila clavipes]|nr:hypothetical protein TNCV_531681 [Trichonephila clavipes]
MSIPASNAIFDDRLPICSTKIEEIAGLSEPMNSDSDSEIDSETPFTKRLHFLVLFVVCGNCENIPCAAGCK